ncbi:MAG: sigma factor-like helix-turn-helix DNA-binding protein, partial [Planctomycetota bacterium]
DVDGDTKAQLDANSQQPVGVTGQLLPEQTAFDDEIAKAIGGLEMIRRSCFLLRVVRNLDYEEIATILDIPPGTAMSHVHRAKSTLRHSLAANFSKEDRHE